MYVFALLLLMTAPALAQDTAIDLDGFLGSMRPYLEEIVALLITAAVGYAVKLLRDKTGIDVEARHREALQSALSNGARKVLAKVVPEKTGIKIEVGNQTIADGVEYVLKSVPDALNYLGLSKEDVKRMLEPHLIAQSADKNTLLGEVSAEPDAKKTAAAKK